MLASLDLVDCWCEGSCCLNLGEVDEPFDAGGCNTVVEPRGEVVGISARVCAIEYYIDCSCCARNRPGHYVCVGRVAVDLEWCRPACARVGGYGEVDVVVCCVDPGDVHVASLVRGQRCEEVSDRASGARGGVSRTESKHVPLPGVHMSFGDVDVVCLYARQVEVAEYWVEG